MTLEQIKKNLEDRNLRVISRRTGISTTTIYSMMRGEIKNPSKETLEKIEKYLLEPLAQ